MKLNDMIPLGLTATQIFDHHMSTESKDQSNLLKHLGGMGPYVQGTGFGIPVEFNWNIKPDKVFIFGRHGERYPTKSVAKRLKSVFDKLKGAEVEHSKGPLSFVKNWEYFIPGPDWLGMETLYGDFNGFQTMYDFGKDTKLKYGYLYENCDDLLPIFTASMQRCVDSAEEFGKGFFNDDEEQIGSKFKLVLLNETREMGADTLTTSISCHNYIHRGNYFKHPYIGKYMVQEAKRLNVLSPGFNITAKDVYSLSVYCAFELNAVGKSKVCEALSLSTFAELEYFRDAELWYERANHPFSFVLGSVYVDAMVKLFDEKETKQNLFFSFTHDTELLHFMKALGIFEHQIHELSTRDIDFARFFKTSELVPMGARIIIERYTIKGNRYIRVLINNAVIPIPECQNGPAYTCKLSKFKALLNEKLQAGTFEDKCRITEERPKQLTFYWDWDKRF